MMTEEQLHLGNTALCITERCTLKCKLCFAFIPYHTNPRHMTIADINKVLKRYFSIVSSVDRFCITGGEPLLHPGLLMTLEVLNGYASQVNKTIDLITNGTLYFKREILEFLEGNKEKTRVIVSDYGKHSPKATAVVGQLSSLGINYRIEDYNGKAPLHGGWIDCRDTSLKHFTQHDVDEQGKSCYFKRKRGYTIRKGELHNCGRSYWRMLKNIIPRKSDEFLDLLDTTESVEKQRELLMNMHKKVSVTSCAYCWGTNSHCERYPPAEQLSTAAPAFNNDETH